MSEIISTHWEGCWRNRSHHACAVARVERLQAELENCREKLEESGKEERRAIEFATEKARELAECQEKLDQEHWEWKTCNETVKRQHERIFELLQATCQSTAEVKNKHSEPDELRAEALHSDDCFHKSVKEGVRVKEVERQNELMRNDLDHYKAEYLKCRKALAAAEAREQELRGVLYELVQKYIANLGSEHEFVVCITPERIPSYWQRAKEVLREKPEHAALDAALEQARKDTLVAVADAIFDDEWRGDIDDPRTVKELAAEIYKRLERELEQARAEGRERCWKAAQRRLWECGMSKTAEAVVEAIREADDD